MSDDLVKLLRRPYGNPTFFEKRAIADRIEQLAATNEELEAKLAKAVEALGRIEQASLHYAQPEMPELACRYAHETTRRIARTTLTELKGQEDET